MPICSLLMDSANRRMPRTNSGALGKDGGAISLTLFCISRVAIVYRAQRVVRCWQTSAAIGRGRELDDSRATELRLKLTRLDERLNTFDQRFETVDEGVTPRHASHTVAQILDLVAICFEVGCTGAELGALCCLQLGKLFKVMERVELRMDKLVRSSQSSCRGTVR